MTKKILLSIAGVLVLLVAGTALYVYMSMPSAAERKAAIQAQPNNSIAAGPVVSVSASAITIKKQDGTPASFSVTADTIVSLAQDGQASAPSNIGAIKAGTIVLITPAARDAEVAQTIVILPPPIPVSN